MTGPIGVSSLIDIVQPTGKDRVRFCEISSEIQSLDRSKFEIDTINGTLVYLPSIGKSPLLKHLAEVEQFLTCTNGSLAHASGCDDRLHQMISCDGPQGRKALSV